MIPVTSMYSMPPLPDFVAAIQAIMQQHGGRLEVSPEGCIASFPTGTVKEQMSLFVVRTVPYEITFPDGYHVWEVVGRDQAHFLTFLISDYPRALVAKHKDVIECNARND